MLRLVLTTDTHLRPAHVTGARGRDLPPALWSAIDSCDVVVHAGDWVCVELLDLLEARAPRVLGCWGNNDGGDLRARLPEVADATVDGVRVRVVHETGAATGREARMDRVHGGDGLLVFGHSHIPWDSTTPAGLRLLNPGSPTDRRRQPTGTFVTLSLDDGAVRDVVLHAV